MDHRWCYMERPLGKTSWKDPLERSLGKGFFQESEGSCQGIFHPERPLKPSKGSFPRTSLTVHSVYDSISKKKFADILKHMDGNKRKWKIFIGFKLISYVLLSLLNIIIIKNGRQFEIVALNLRVKSFEFGLISRTYPC